MGNINLVPSFIIYRPPGISPGGLFIYVDNAFGLWYHPNESRADKFGKETK